ncbi:MAG: hypothetical protein ACREQW_20985 [Candidatus Binatia bacterium]
MHEASSLGSARRRLWLAVQEAHRLENPAPSTRSSGRVFPLQPVADDSTAASSLEAAIMGGKLYLGAYAQGLGASVLTFFDDDVTDFFAPQTAGKSVMSLGSGAWKVSSQAYRFVSPYRSKGPPVPRVSSFIYS